MFNRKKIESLELTNAEQSQQIAKLEEELESMKNAHLGQETNNTETLAQLESTRQLQSLCVNSSVLVTSTINELFSTSQLLSYLHQFFQESLTFFINITYLLSITLCASKYIISDTLTV